MGILCPNSRATDGAHPAGVRRRTVAWTLGLFALAAVAHGEQIPFTPRAAVALDADAAFAAVSTDLDGDGDLDLVSASWNDDTVAWYENDGTADTWTAHPITTTAGGARGLAAGDLDGDGDPDLLVGAADDDTVAWFENDLGSATPWTAHVITTAAGNTRGVTAADVDGDGDLDVVWTASDDNTVAWHENTAGDGSAWTLHSIATAAAGARGVLAADIDGDGDLDVAAALELSDEVAWYENGDGVGSSWTAHSVTTINNDALGAVAVAAGDVDHDGDVDLVAAEFEGGFVHLYRNLAGDGSTWSTVNIASVSSPTSVAFADLDADGDLDVMSTSLFNNAVSWHENTAGDGSAWTAWPITSAATFASSVLAADLDADGDLDVAWTAEGADELAWHRNDTIHRSAWFPASATVGSSAVDPESVATGDLDGDGDLDVVSASFADNRIAWYRNDGGDAATWTAFPITTDAGAVFGVSLADLDRDGDLDVIGAALGDDFVGWYENDAGDGSAWTEHAIDAAVDGARAALAADVDGDGDLDVASIGRDGGTVAWHENLGGDPLAWSTHTIDGGAAFPLALALGDVDGDGAPDVVAATRDDDSVTFYRNAAGDGSSWVPQIVTAGAAGAGAVRLADVDRDGDLDTVVGSRDDDTVAWYENTAGDGSAWTQHVVTTAADVVFAVAAADLDGDGDVDLLSASNNDGSVAWYENLDGDGGSWTRSVLTSAETNATWVEAADLDGDGDLDVLSTATGTDRVAWYENLGGQVAVAVADTAPAELATADDVLRVTIVHRGRDYGDGELDSAAQLSTLALAFDDGNGAALSTDEAQARLSGVAIYLDDGDLLFDADADTLVETVAPLSLAGGVLTVPFTDGDPLIAIDRAAERSWFVVLQPALGFDGSAPDHLRVTVAADGVAATDLATDLALDVEGGRTAVSSGVVTVPVTVDLAISKSDGVDFTDAGESLTYAVVVSNPGPLEVLGATVSDTPPAVLSCAWTCLAAGGGTCAAAGTGAIADTVDLPAGASVTYTVQCDVAADASGDIVNTATVAPPPGMTDLVPGNDSATDTDRLASIFAADFEAAQLGEWDASEPQ